MSQYLIYIMTQPHFISIVGFINLCKTVYKPSHKLHRFNDRIGLGTDVKGSFLNVCVAMLDLLHQNRYRAARSIALFELVSTNLKRLLLPKAILSLSAHTYILWV